MKRQSKFATLMFIGTVAGCGKGPEPVVVDTSTIPVAPAIAKVETPPKVENAQVKPKADSPKVEPKAEEPQKVETPSVGFEFPSDAGGKSLATILPPSFVGVERDRTNLGPKPRALPPYLEPGNIPVPDAINSPVMLRVGNQRAIHPMTLPERVPSDFAPPVELPALPVVEVTKLHTQPSRDPSEPAELPFLSNKPIIDRAPLADPTLDYTAQTVISNMLPLRIDMATFMKLTIPEPFESITLPTKATPPEDPNKVLTPPPLPKN